MLGFRFTRVKDGGLLITQRESMFKSNFNAVWIPECRTRSPRVRVISAEKDTKGFPALISTHVNSSCSRSPPSQRESLESPACSPLLSCPLLLFPHVVQYSATRGPSPSTLLPPHPASACSPLLPVQVGGPELGRMGSKGADPTNIYAGTSVCAKSVLGGGWNPSASTTAFQ